MVVSCGVKNACESSPDESYLTYVQIKGQHATDYTTTIVKGFHNTFIPPEVFRLIGWIDEVVVWIVRKL